MGIHEKFDRCVKSVKKTVRARKGSNKESAAIAICTKSVLQKRGRTLKRYSRKRLITQKKLRGGDVNVAKQVIAALQADVQQAERSSEPYVVDLTTIPNYSVGVQYILTKLQPARFGFFSNQEEETTKKLLKEDLEKLLKENGKLTIYDVPEFRESVKYLTKLQ